MATTVSTRSQARKQSSATTHVAAKTRSKPVAKLQVVLPSIAVTKKKLVRDKAEEIWCICHGHDDKTPMILCECCKDWFHFSCINLSDRDAEEIEVYICEACHVKTGQSTVYAWEGPDAIGDDMGGSGKVDGNPVKAEGKKDKTDTKSPISPEEIPDEEEEDAEQEASSDDYKEGQDENAGARSRGLKRVISSDEENEENEGTISPRTSRRNQLKRKRSKETQRQRKRTRKPMSDVGSDNDIIGEARKKSKSNTDTSDMDPTRKYCLDACREVLLPIFVQFAKVSNSEADAANADEPTEDEKKAAEHITATYVRDLEMCLYDLYGEIDKQGHKVPGAKYRERLRMLKFNLAQPDRHQLRRRIGTQTLPALELSRMSSVDLANEHLKQQIEAANRESLAHSILKEMPHLPRAKMTHKGEEVIEDLEGDDTGRRIREQEQREREREKEREKFARERARSLTRPQDILAHQQNIVAARAQAEQLASIETTPAAEASPEASLRFDDLITMDTHDHPAEESVPPAQPTDSSARDNLPTTSTGPSASPTLLSFNLDNVWSGSSAPTGTPITQNVTASPGLAPRPHELPDAPSIELDIATGAHDEDFDMFLEDKADSVSATPLLTGPEAEKAVFTSLPIVWSGNIFVPDVGKSPAVQARQVGGRTIEGNSTQWQILFPPHHAQQLRVEGRVPVKDSGKYLTQNRLNVTRELVVVALSPIGDPTDYNEIIAFFLNRDRHAVVLPWGPNPGPDAPGKELYLIPVLPDGPLPDYVELLDVVKFPKKREEKMLLGVFILNKGKFSAAPSPTSTALFPLIPPPPPVASTSSALLSSANLPPPPLPVASQTMLPLPAAAPEIINKLTKEQIDSLLQTVLASGGLSAITGMPPAPAPTISPPQPAPVSSAFPPSLANLIPNQVTPVPPAISPPAPPAPSVYPYGAVPGAQGSSSYTPPAPQRSPSTAYGYSSSRSPPLDHDYRGPPLDHDYRGPPGNYARPGKGDLREDRPRGRGRPSDRGIRSGRGSHDNDFDRPRDSGWAGRGRGRSAGHRSPQSHWGS